MVPQARPEACSWGAGSWRGDEVPFPQSKKKKNDPSILSVYEGFLSFFPDSTYECSHTVLVCLCPTSLSVMPASATHAAARGRISFLLAAEQLSTEDMPTGGPLDCFRVLVTVNKAAVNMREQKSL